MITFAVNDLENQSNFSANNFLYKVEITFIISSICILRIIVVELMTINIISLIIFLGMYKNNFALKINTATKARTCHASN